MTTAALLLAGAALIRYLAAPAPIEAPLVGRESVADSLLAAGDSAVAEKERRSRPFEPGETIDANVATEEELDRLPGVGPATARRIVEDRDANGPFAGPDDLARVSGIGPATVERMRPLLRMTGGGRRAALAAGPQAGGSAWPAAARAGAAAGPGGAEPAGAEGAPGGRPVNVNRATAAELQVLPGIGPVTAERIVAYRRERGPFRTAEELTGVAGIGARTLARIAPMITVGR